MIKRILGLACALALAGPAAAAPSLAAGGAITTANAFQSVLPATRQRLGCLIQNTSANSELAFVGPNASASAAAAVVIASGGSFNCAAPGGLVVTDEISITSGVAGSTFVVLVQ